MFPNELTLQEKFIELKKMHLKKNESILSEFNARFGNVDVVKVIMDNSNLMNYKQAKLLSNYQLAKVFAYLHNKAIRTFDYLADRTDYDEKALSYLLSKLIKANIVNEVTPQRYIISDKFQFPTLQFSSYEAKLSKWKKAILQATINKKFSSYSHVVLPMNIASRLYDSRINYFLDHNVGLIGVSNSRIEYFLKPKKDLVKIQCNPSFISSVAKYQIETSMFSNTIIKEKLPQ